MLFHMNSSEVSISHKNDAAGCETDIKIMDNEYTPSIISNCNVTQIHYKIQYHLKMLMLTVN